MILSERHKNQAINNYLLLTGNMSTQNKREFDVMYGTATTTISTSSPNGTEHNQITIRGVIRHMSISKRRICAIFNELGTKNLATLTKTKSK